MTVAIFREKWIVTARQYEGGPWGADCVLCLDLGAGFIGVWFVKNDSNVHL